MLFLICVCSFSVPETNIKREADIFVPPPPECVWDYPTATDDPTDDPPEGASLTSSLPKVADHLNEITAAPLPHDVQSRAKGFTLKIKIKPPRRSADDNGDDDNDDDVIDLDSQECSPEATSISPDDVTDTERLSMSPDDDVDDDVTATERMSISPDDDVDDDVTDTERMSISPDDNVHDDVTDVTATQPQDDVTNVTTESEPHVTATQPQDDVTTLSKPTPDISQDDVTTLSQDAQDVTTKPTPDISPADVPYVENQIPAQLPCSPDSAQPVPSLPAAPEGAKTGAEEIVADFGNFAARHIHGKGLGIVAKGFISAGTTLCPYLGQNVPRKMGESRNEKYATDNRKQTMIWDLQASPQFCVDGYVSEFGKDFAKYENPAILFNHSLDSTHESNCKLSRKGKTMQTTTLSLVTIVDVQPGEELVWDYGDRQKGLEAWNYPSVSTSRRKSRGTSTVCNSYSQ